MCSQASVWLLSHSGMLLYSGMCILVFRLTWFCLSSSIFLHQYGSFWAGGFTSNAERHWWWILIAFTSCDKAKHISALWLVARELRMASHVFHLLQGPLGLQNSIKPQSRICLLIIQSKKRKSWGAGEEKSVLFLSPPSLAFRLHRVINPQDQTASWSHMIPSPGIGKHPCLFNEALLNCTLQNTTANDYI